MSLDLDRFLPYQLAVAAARISREFSALYRERFGISIPEWRVVAHLSQSGPVSVREIHERVDMDKSKVSRAAARLEAAGYVAKTPNPADRRLIALELTPAGHAMIEDIAPVARQFEAEVMARLGDLAEPFREGLAALAEDRPPKT
ncbi:MarR family winged helix-turn-helix transcriptional regulator [Tranquillimonas alkanivorans]|uniref:DNA-binding transcriptional regulator, MarR family n=1 Tax=Tranquillimonas alkanivorans TaxID=441119 RepID=A0A1I5L584_9RHOB|nr:MarR family transcriptional regulator [Tranquillimonas alkanivorans]SFO92480.1 DNA-binding transcriptional regulator, MarR family [Tranquillimonas alkanivorans]